MSNEKKPENPSVAHALDHAPKKERHYWFVDGLVNSLSPRLGEIKTTTELILSESSLDLIDYLFGKYEIDLGELNEQQLVSVANVMPAILADLERLAYPSGHPKLFECAKAFGARVEEAVKGRGLEAREKVAEVLKD